MKKPKNWFSRVLPKNVFARSVGVLIGGTAGTQFLAILAAPILTRLYTPEDFGVLAVYGGVLSLFSVIASGRYELAIPLPEAEEDAAQIVCLSLIVVCLSSFFIAVLAACFGGTLIQKLGMQQFSKFIWLVPIGVLFAGTYSIFSYWAIRSKNYGGIARTRLKQTVVMLLIQICGFKIGAASLIVSQAIGQGVGTLELGKSFIVSVAKSTSSWDGIKKTAVQYRRFPFYSTWEGFFNTAGYQLPPLLFATLFSPAIAGMYSLANRVLSIPMSLLGNAVGQVFLGTAANARRSGQLDAIIKELSSKLSIIALSPAIMLAFIGPELFTFVFGNDWREAGRFAQWMAPWLYFVFISSPLSSLFSVMEKQIQSLVMQAVLLIIRLIAIYVGVIFNDVNLAIILFSLGSAVFWAFSLYWIGRTSGNNGWGMLRPTLSEMPFAILCSGPLVLMEIFGKNISGGWLVGLGASLTILAVRYAIAMRKVY